MNQFDTHAVLNQAPPFENVNLLRCDPALREGLVREGAGWALAQLDALGAQLGRAEVLELARLANAHGPRLHAFDRSGQRIDEVEFHPAWHELMRMMIGAGAHCAPWLDARPGAQVARAGAYLLFGQVESVGRAVLPGLASFLLFGTLAAVLVVRPRGLFTLAPGGRR